MGPVPSSSPSSSLELSRASSSATAAAIDEKHVLVKKERPNKNKEQQKSSNNWIYIAVAVIVALVAGGAVAAVLLLVVKPSSDTSQASANESSGRDAAVLEAQMFEDYSCGITLMEYPDELASSTEDNIFSVQDDTPYNRPLECNQKMIEDLTDGLSCCDTTFSSFLAANADQEDLLIPCGECVIMDLNQGDTIELPGGLHIEGMLYFPPSSNVLLRTTHVFVIGTLKIDTPHPGNQVKVQLYGDEDTSFMNNGRYPSLELCLDSCNFGPKPIAVIGGRLEIQAYDPECPAWEKLQDVRGPESVPSPGTVAPETLAPAPAVTFPCGSDDIIENGDFEGGLAFWHNSGNHPVSVGMPGSGQGGQYLTASGRAAWNNGIQQFLDMECMLKGQKWLVNAKVRLTDEETGNQVSCDPNTLHDCPFVRLVFGVGTSNSWFEYPDADLNWSTTTEWNDLAVTVPIEIEDFSLVTLVLCGGRAGTIIEVDDVTMIPLQVSDTSAITTAPVVATRETSAPVTIAPVATATMTPAPVTSDAAFPCGFDDLVVNGDAEGGTAFWHNFGKHPVSVGTSNPGEGGQYLMASGRSEWGMGLRQFPNMECVVKGQEWLFNAKLRLTDEETGNPVSCDPNTLHDCPLVRFVFAVGTDHRWFEYPDADLNWSTTAEWNDFQVTVPIEIGDFSSISMIICGGRAGTILEADDVTMVPLMRRRERHLETDLFSRLVVSQKASTCWGAGSELLLTSHTRDFADRQVVTVESVDEELGILTLTDTINKPITQQDHAVFAVEVASLSRSVVFEAESNLDDDMIGGHLIIYWTPTPQHLEGVEIRNFGQQGKLGRYPTHFHFCGNSKGSAMKKNVVRGSNQRGYVLHQTNEVLVEENVAFDILGHCFFLEDGVEENNTFKNNLGADVKKATKLLSAQSGRKETDDSPSVFWISNAANFFYGNVAAGGGSSGFWFETPGSRAYIDLGAFDDNSAHSMESVGFTSYPPGWQPVHEAVMSNLNLYRNMRSGMFLHVTRNLHFKGGIIADNGWHGVMNLQGDSVTFEGTKIIGVSYDETGDPPPCGSLGALGPGMILHPTKLQQSNNTGVVTGTTLIDVEFLNFSPEKSGCPEGEAALTFTEGSHIVIPTFDAPHFFTNVLVEEGTSPLDACPLDEKYGLDDIIIEIVEDNHASFSTEARPGFLLSPKFSIFAGDQLCSPYSDCLDFCPDACMRTVRVLTNGVAENSNMIVSDGVNSITLTRAKLFPKYSSGNDSRYNGVFNVALPAGQFNIRFEDVNGSLVFPDYAIPIMEAAPSCTNVIERTDITIDRPDPNESVCSDLIKNGDFDADTSNWQQFYVGMEWDANSGAGQTGALRSTIRSHPGHALSQWLNTNCLQDGDTYDFTMSFKLLFTISGFEYPLDCAAETCPNISLDAYSLNDDSGEMDRTVIRSITNSLSDNTDADGFWTLTGSWQVNNDQHLADQLKFTFIVTQPNVQFIVDNIHLTKTN